MKTASVFTAAVVAGAATLFAGCSGATAGPAAGMPATDSTQSRLAALRAVVLPSGIDTRYSRLAPVLSSLSARRAKVERDLFVTTGGPEMFELKNKSYVEVGEITNGLDASDGVWVDKHGNVYVANVGGPNVVEYKRGGSTPICTYSSGIVDPVDVTTDEAGNVYVDDFNELNNPGHVQVFPQCQNTVSKEFNTGLGPTGIAVDKLGNLFVEYIGSKSTFEEFKAGSISPTPLGASVSSPGGMVLDKKGNLIADDQAGNIDVIAPPYGSATILVSGLSGPFRCSLNRRESLLFNANADSDTITVYKYPSGTLVTTLDGHSYGFNSVEGVGESPNAVF